MSTVQEDEDVDWVQEGVDSALRFLEAKGTPENIDSPEGTTENIDSTTEGVTDKGTHEATGAEAKSEGTTENIDSLDGPADDKGTHEAIDATMQAAKHSASNKIPASSSCTGYVEV